MVNIFLAVLLAATSPAASLNPVMSMICGNGTWDGEFFEMDLAICVWSQILFTYLST